MERLTLYAFEQGELEFVGFRGEQGLGFGSRSRSSRRRLQKTLEKLCIELAEQEKEPEAP